MELDSLSDWWQKKRTSTSVMLYEAAKKNCLVGYCNWGIIHHHNHIYISSR